MTFSHDSLYSTRARRVEGAGAHRGGRGDEGIGLHWGFPFADSFPIEDLARAAGEALLADGQWACQYGGGAKTRLLTRLISGRLERRGLQLKDRELVITNGAAQALDLLAAVFLDPGDLVIVEAPTFMGALGQFSTYGAGFLPVAVDAAGMVVDDLEAELDALRSAGGNMPKMAYVIPSFHNPTGVSMTIARRKQLLSLAERYGFVVVEDDAYGELYFNQPPPDTIQSLDRSGLVVYVGTVSKIIAPGLRIGWTLAAPDVSARISRLKGDGTTNPVIQSAVAQYWETGDLDARIGDLRRAYRQRWQAMDTTLRRYMPGGVTWSQPEGGFFTWVSLPEGSDAGGVARRARERGVTVLAGDTFFPPGAARPALRLSFSFAPTRDLTRGVRLLSQVLAETVT